MMVIEKITKTYSVRTIYGFIKAMLILIFAIYFAIVTYSSNIVPISYAASLIMLYSRNLVNSFLGCVTAALTIVNGG